MCKKNDKSADVPAGNIGTISATGTPPHTATTHYLVLVTHLRQAISPALCGTAGTIEERLLPVLRMIAWNLVTSTSNRFIQPIHVSTTQDNHEPWRRTKRHANGRC